MPSAVRLVIFDNDGVLVDSERLANTVLARLLTGYGHPVSMDQCVERFMGGTLERVRSAVEGELGSALPAEFEDRYHRDLFAAFDASLQAVDGVAQVLDHLSEQGVPFCVASSGTHERIRTSLGKAGLLGYFPDDRRFSAEDVERGKPAPDLFLHAAQSVGVAPGHCAIIEDSPSGVRAGKAAGGSVVGFAGLIPPDRLVAVGADHVITTMTEVVDLVLAPAGARSGRGDGDR